MNIMCLRQLRKQPFLCANPESEWAVRSACVREIRPIRSSLQVTPQKHPAVEILVERKIELRMNEIIARS